MSKPNKQTTTRAASFKRRAKAIRALLRTPDFVTAHPVVKLLIRSLAKIEDDEAVVLREQYKRDAATKVGCKVANV